MQPPHVAGGCAEGVSHQEVKDVSPRDCSCNVISLQGASLVLLGVIPRSKGKFQYEHFTCLQA